MEQKAVLERVLKASFRLYFQAHSFHWNVRGKEFFALHSFFEEMYTNIWKSTDDIAERIRILGFDAPKTIAEMVDNDDIADTTEVPSAEKMLDIFANNLDTIISILEDGAEKSDESNRGFLTELGDGYRKTRWMLKSTMQK